MFDINKFDSVLLSHVEIKVFTCSGLFDISWPSSKMALTFDTALGNFEFVGDAGSANNFRLTPMIAGEGA